MPEDVVFNYIISYLFSILSIENYTLLDILKSISSQVTGSILFFVCYYFGTLLFALILFLAFSSNCYNTTDNIVLTASSYIISLMFLVLFYTFTKDMVGGKVISAFLATLLFLFLEFFLIAVLIIVLVEPFFNINENKIKVTKAVYEKNNYK